MNSLRNRSFCAPAPVPLFSEEEIFTKIDAFLCVAKKPIICIVGATGSGKTDFSIRLCKKYNGEIINADSRQFYKGMDIGTAKITKKEMEGIPHHLFSFLEPSEQCTAAEFKEKAEEIIEEILSRKKIPFLVGGTGLFVDVLRENFSIPRVPPKKEWRKKMEALSAEELYKMLEKKDKKAAEKIHQNNTVRIIRALEVLEHTGEKISDIQKKGRKKWDDMVIGIWIDPDILRNRIEKRGDIFWENGFLEEARHLLSLGYTKDDPGMIAHGYREAIAVLQGEISPEEAKKQMIQNTKKYAKRQRTWWRKTKNVLWFSPEKK